MPNNQKSIQSSGTQNPRDLTLRNGQRVLHPKKGIPLIDFYVKKVAAKGREITMVSSIKRCPEIMNIRLNITSQNMNMNELLLQHNYQFIYQW